MNAALRQALSPARCASGGLRVFIAGESCVLRCSGAMWTPDHSTLIAADLHFEKGSSYARRGQMLPPYDTAATLARLAAEIAALEPRTVVLLGDSLHDPEAAGRLSPDDAALIADLARGRRWIWVEGNHDRDGLTGLPGEVIDTMALGALRLVHEPAAGPSPGEVAGHLHPCVRVAAHGRGVRRRCFATDGQRIILPAFGAYAGGLNLRDPAFAGLFSEPPLAAALGRDRVHALAWSSLLGEARGG